MMQKFKRGFAAAMSAMLIMTSYTPITTYAAVTPHWGTDSDGNVICFDETTNEYATIEDAKTEAKCTAVGSIVYTATFEDGEKATYTVEIPAKGHTEGTAVKDSATEVLPTCESDGYYYMVTYCTVCGEELDRTKEIVTKTGHIAGEPYNAGTIINPTCETEGSYKEETKCTNCGVILKAEIKTLPAKGHTTATREGKVVEATCTKAGSKEIITYCTECENVLGTTVETLTKDHSWEETDNYENATCYVDGYQEFKCSECGTTKKETIPATEHQNTYTLIDRTKIVLATCTEPGSYVETTLCSECYKEIDHKTVEIPAKGHSWDSEKAVVVTPATCTTDGVLKKVCSVCGATETEKIEATGHDKAADIQEESKENYVAATCTADGSYDKVKYCTKCGTKVASTTVKTPKLSHANFDYKEKEGSRVEATCTTAGYYTKVKYCKDCGKELDQGTRVTILAAHQSKEECTKKKVDIKKATCTEEGSYKYVYICNKCGKEVAEDDPITVTSAEGGHQWKTVKVVKAATCKDEGEETQVCTICETGRTVTIPALKHEGYMEVQYVTKKATCKEEGVALAICSKCGYKDAKYPIEKVKNHDWKTAYSYNGAVTDKAPAVEDCTEGLSYKVLEKCSICGETTDEDKWQDVVIAAKAHAFTGKIVWNNGNDGSGVASFACANCKKFNNIEFTADPASGYVVKTEASDTCVSTGNREYVATVYYQGVKATGTKNIPGQAITVNGTAAKHKNIVTDAAVAATCNTKGKTAGSHCTECGAVIVAQEEVDYAHNIVVDAAVAATCTKSGLTEGTHCSICNTVFVAQEKVDALGHTEVKDEAVEATCTNTGLTAGSHCSVCNEVIVKQEIVPMNPHTVITQAAKEPTCSEEGYTSATVCYDCGKVFVEGTAIPKIAHTAGTAKKESIVKATSTKNGSYYENTYCTVCGEKISSVKKTIVKQSIVTKATSKTYTVAAVKSAKRSFAIGATAKRAKITYKKVSGSSALTLSSTGVVTVKKGTKKGTYTMKVTINASASTGYAAATKTVTIKVVVK